jgi:hypothetical protein
MLCKVEFFSAVTMKNAVFWDTRPTRRHIPADGILLTQDWFVDIMKEVTY